MKCDAGTPMNENRPDISLVIPVYNEAPNIDELVDRSFATLEKIGRSFEVVTVDDGSTDGSCDLLLKRHQADNRLRIVRLLRNFGQTPAIYAGMAHSRGEVVVLIDADLQNPPEEIIKLLEKIDEGYDVVQGWRTDRKDSPLRIIPSRMLNAFISKTINAKVHDLGCGLKAFRRDTVERMNLFQHKARYLPAEMFWLGVNIAEVKVEHNERRRGKSKYNALSLAKLCFDIVTGLSMAPVRLVAFAGWALILAGILLGLLAGVGTAFGRAPGTPAIVSALVLGVGGIQVLAIGVVCEYVSRIYIETQRRPYYLVKDVIE